MKISDLEAIIESILFISSDAVALGDIADAIEMDKATTKAIISSMADRLVQEKRGIQIIEVDGAYQMTTAPWCFEYIKRIYMKAQRQALSQTLLETLAIIAYKQPITKSQIEEIRGVNSDHAVNRLVEKKLVCEVGRLDSPGKPVLFGTTREFLRYFGFTSVDELPALNDSISVMEEEIENRLNK